MTASAQARATGAIATASITSARMSGTAAAADDRMRSLPPAEPAAAAPKPCAIGNAAAAGRLRRIPHSVSCAAAFDYCFSQRRVVG